jgi:hypothetical protein
MLIVCNIHDSWLASPAAVAEFVRRAHTMERPSVALTPPPAAAVRPTAPAAAAEDLRELLSGMDDDAPPVQATPSVATQSTPPWTPPLATPASRRPPATPQYDGIPVSGQNLYRFACDRKILPKVNAMGRARGFNRLVTHWTVDQVAVVFAELTAPAAPVNGRH